MRLPDTLSPAEIERRSFEIIGQELGDTPLSPLEKSVLMRVIHTTADFDYKENLCFSPGAAQNGIDALKQGCTIVTDTNMARAGVSKPGLTALNSHVECFMADPDVAEAAKTSGGTRATTAIDKAITLTGPLIFAVGNAPTALIRLYEHIHAGNVKPALIVAVPVGFVNVVESKELICSLDLPVIVARGRKGGSTVAAAICNALIYTATGRVV